MKNWFAIGAFAACSITATGVASESYGETAINPAPSTRPLATACTSHPVILDESRLAGFRELSRGSSDDTEARTQILAVNENSQLWQTKCAVALTEIQKDPSPGCRLVPIFSESSILWIQHAVGGFYQLNAWNLNTQEGKLAAIMEAKVIQGKSEENRTVAWLATAFSTDSDFDLYVHLANRRNREGKLEKFYVVEAFAKSDKECESHRPEKSLCRIEEDSSESQIGKECSDDGASTLAVPLFQTHTGGGNENQGFP